MLFFAKKKVRDLKIKKGVDSSKAFRDDADYPLLCSIEVINEDGNVISRNRRCKAVRCRRVVPDDWSLDY